MGQQGEREEPLHLAQSLAVSNASLVENQLGTATLGDILQDMDTQAHLGGGLVSGTYTEDQLDARAADISSRIRNSAEIRVLSPEARRRKLNTVERFLLVAKRMNAKHIEDTLILFAVKMLGKSTGNAIFRACQDIIHV